MNSNVNDALMAQAPRLRDDPELKRFAESRRTLAADPYRPLYHFVSPERTLNDPNGLCFWQGKWHLFFQARPAGDDHEHWGRADSVGVSLRAQGSDAELRALDAWQMKSIYEGAESHE